MADDQREPAPDNASVFNHLIQVLAIVVFIASVAVFCVVDLTLRQGVVQALLISVIPNITASVLIYMALFFSLSRLDTMRKDSDRRELVAAVISGLRSAAAAEPVPVEAVKSSRLPLANTRITPEQQIVVQHFLETMYVFASLHTGKRDLRLYCHQADYETGTLIPVCVAGESRLADYDYRAAIPFRGPRSEPFIIGQALRQRHVVAGDLDTDHLESYPDRLKSAIPASLKCVIAAPIESYSPGDEGLPVGTISVDSASATCAELGFTDASGKVESTFDSMLRSCSRALYQVLMTDSRAAGKG